MVKTDYQMKIHRALSKRPLPELEVKGQRILVEGRWFKVARIQDEDWQVGQVVEEPEKFVAMIRAARLRVDVFTFCQKLPEVRPQYNYCLKWDNVAVIRTSGLSEWWERLPQVTRKNVRRASRRGVRVQLMACDDIMIRGITDIYNEIPIRDGRPFPHYGKDFAAIKREVSTMSDRSQFLGAFHGEELIGFMKLIHMGNVSSILHIVSKQAHYDKRPSNALLNKAVEVCHQRGVDYLIYGQYNYGNRSNSPLTEFKRRNGFDRILVPRYFIPLTVWGRISLALNLHRGIKGNFPTWFVDMVLRLRAKYYEKRLKKFLARRDSRCDSVRKDDPDAGVA
jgi:hypothetical protein